MLRLPEFTPAVPNGAAWEAQNTLWTTFDDCWQVLATCMEVTAALKSPDPLAFVSHLPVHQVRASWAGETRERCGGAKRAREPQGGRRLA